MIQQIYIRNPFNSTLHRGVGHEYAFRDDEADRESVNQERTEGLVALDTALNEGYARIESYAWGDYLVIILHKITREDAIKARQSEDIRAAAAAGIDYETGLPLRQDKAR